jgi:hypothetical protein
MDKELQIIFTFLIGYVQMNHYNKMNFSVMGKVTEASLDRDVQAQNCLFLLGQRLGIEHSELNQISDETAPDLTLGRG